ncbi:MAG: hypothetical protein AAF492_31165, partial [Verrucomicrobiota bacterium]
MNSFRTRYTNSVYPAVRIAGWVLLVMGVLLAPMLRFGFGVVIETRSLLLTAQILMALGGLLMVLSRYFLSPQLLLSLITLLFMMGM